jgi:hypothetical protein
MSNNLEPSSVASSSKDAGDQRLVLFDTVLVLEPAAPGSWRVREDRGFADRPRYLAFIQEVESGFEVMQVASTLTWSTFATMHSALVHVAITSRAIRMAQSRGDLAWLA